MLVVTILSHCYNSRTGSAETKVESHASPETQPNQASLLLNTACIQPGSQLHQCVGNTLHLATWLACTAPGPPQESLVRDETRISLQAKPSLTRTTLGQLCVVFFLPLFLPNFVVSNCFLVATILSHRLQLPYGLGRDEG